jgi:chromosome segregation ATPase
VQLDVVPLFEGALPRASPEVVAAFRADFQSLENELEQLETVLADQIETVEALHTALMRSTAGDTALVRRLENVRQELLELRERLEGSEARDEVGERDPPSPGNRLNVAESGLETTYGPTELHQAMLAAAGTELEPIRGEIERMAEQVVPELEAAVEAAGAPPRVRQRI